MRYISIDLETTGLNPRRHQILEFGAVIADTTDFETPILDLPSFHGMVDYQNWEIEPVAAAMHAKSGLLGDIVAASQRQIPLRGNLYSDIANLLMHFGNFLSAHNMPTSFTAAGKNFAGFDLQFLNEIPYWKRSFNVHMRSLDPSILFLRPGDEKIPNTMTCLERISHHDPDPITHRALDDARDVVLLIRRGLQDKWGFTE